MRSANPRTPGSTRAARLHRIAGLGLALLLANAASLGAQAFEPTSIELTGTIRDFSGSHPDMQYRIASDPGIVEPILGPDGKPVYTTTRAFTATTHGREPFDQWYRDVPGVNLTAPQPLTLTNSAAAPDIYTFDSSDFFPIDGQLFGNEGQPHNYYFTFELHTRFTYQGGEVFQFRGDDDVFAFVNDRLVIDLGGVHGPQSATVALDAVASQIGLSPGGTYDLDFFFAERFCCGSNFRMQTSILLEQPPETGGGATLEYAGDLAGDFDDPATVAARLVDDALDPPAPIPDSLVTFTLGERTCRAPTDADGLATCHLTPDLPAGDHELTASFAGDVGHPRADLERTFAVTAEETTLALVSPPVQAGPGVLVRAVLREDGALPLGGRTVLLRSGATSATATTDGDGIAVATLDLAAGEHAVEASFAGDEHHEPAEAAGTHRLLPPQLVLAPSAQTADAGGAAAVTARLLDLGAPRDGIAVGFRVASGPNAGAAGTCPAGACVTGPDGTVAFTYPGGPTAGADTVEAFVDLDGDGLAGAAEPAANARVLWRSSVATSLRYTGAGAGDFHDPVRLAAVLEEASGAAIPGARLRFALAGETCAATTGVDGDAACFVTPQVAAGDAEVSVTFDGSLDHRATTAAVPFSVTREQTVLTLDAPPALPAGETAVSARLAEDGALALAGRAVTFTAGPVSVTATTGPDGVASTVLPLPLGVHEVEARFAGGPFYEPATDRAASLVVYEPGQFVIWGGNAPTLDAALAVGQTYPFWGARWDAQVSAGDYAANASFKGYADLVSPGAATWETLPGNSSAPPPSVPEYMSVIVATSIEKLGNTISGDVAAIAVVRVLDPTAYRPDPGHDGFGELLSLLPAAGPGSLPHLPPGPPEGVQAVAAGGFATVSWSPPADAGSTPVTGYSVVVSPGAIALAAPAEARSRVVPGLAPGTPFSFQVVAHNGGGEGPPSDAAGPVVPVDVPGAPSGVVAEAADGSVTVRWQPPADDGGAAVSAYLVAASPGEAGISVGGGATSATLDGLFNGATYVITVRAVNAVGSGPPSAPTTAAPRTLPGAPAVVLATPGDRRATVYWSAPADDGGSGIAAYAVTAAPGGTITTIAGDRAVATLDGLDNGTAYTFVVQATGPAGDGPASSGSPPVIPFGAPGAPVVGSPQAGNASVRVAWSAPADGGGRPVSGFLVSEGPGKPRYSAPASELDRVVAELVNGTGLSFAVTAVNEAGEGAASAASETVVPSTVPGPPLEIAASAEDDGTLSVSWQAPEDDGGSEVEAYRIEAHAADPDEPPGVLAVHDTAGPETDGVISGLDPGSIVVVTVRAVNAHGAGPQSAPTEPVTASVPPGPPTDVLAVASAPATATVSWLPPADDGGTEISSYTVTSTPEGLSATVDGETTSAVVPGLSLGTSYTFTVAAQNAVATGEPSTPSNALIAATVPDPPTGVAAMRGDRQALVSWSAPAFDGFSPISSYTVTASPGGASAVVDGGTLSVAVGGLANGTTYTFTVGATNTVGTGAPSEPSSPVTPATVPGAPGAVSAARAGDRAIEVAWTPPADDGASPITAYTVTSSPGGLTETVGGSTASVVVGDLAAGVAYTFRVTATNDLGIGPASAPSNAVVAATVPGAASDVTAVDGDGEATVTWTAPADDGASPITSYTVTASPGGVSVTGDGDASSATVAGLANGTTYVFTVTATNAVGDGPPSAPSNPVTPAGVPGAPTAVAAEVGGDAAARVHWTAPVSDGGAAIASYTVVSSPGGFTATVAGEADHATVDGLVLGEAYTFTVRATNRRGDGPASEPSNPVTAVAVPDPPTEVNATAGDASATVAWTAPAEQGGGPVLSYRVVSEPGAIEVVIAAPETTVTVPGLDNGTTYTFTVIATNAVGDSPASEPSNPVTPQPAGVVALASLSIDPARVVGGTIATGTVALTGPAEAGGVAVALASSDPAAATVPAEVVVPEGATSADFAIQTGAVTAPTAVEVSASLDTTTITVTLGIDPIPAGTAPSAEIVEPADDASVTAPTDVVGSATAGDFDHYVLEVAPAGEPTFTEIARGTAPVASGVLGTFDPTLLLNDLYTVRLTVVDTFGRTATSAVTVQVEGALKVGNFTLSFVDLSIPVSGLPVTVIRTYDSRDRGRGDFGVGWRLEVKTLRIRDNGVQGAGWRVDQSGGALPTFFLRPNRAHRVSLRLPTGRVEEFDFTPTPSSQALVPLRFLSPGYTPRPGTTGSLRLAEDTQLQVIGDQPGDVELLDLDTVDTYDPQTFVYTALDGREWLIDEVDGVRRITDRHGNTLTLGPGGITHSSGVGITFTRDGLGRITSITDPAGAIQTYDYGAAGDLVSYSDAVGNETTFAYNDHYLTEVIDPLGRPVARNEYDEDGRLVATTDASGNSIELEHDLEGRREVVVDRLGRSRVLEYNERGDVTRETDAEGGVIARTFDERGRLLSETGPQGGTRTFTYTSDDLVETLTDPLGNSTSVSYDEHGQPVTITDPRGQITELSYDARGNLTEMTDRAGNSTSFAYDAAGNMIRRTDPEGGTTSYVYDSAGNVVQATDPAGNEVSWTYDANGRKTAESQVVTTPDGNQTITTSFAYDAAGRLTGLTLPDGITRSLSYDPAGNLATLEDALGRVLEMNYDEAGRPAETIRPDGTTTRRTYDAEDRIVSRVDAAGRTTRFEYDGVGRLRTTTFADGTTEIRGYDAAGRLTSLTDGRGNTTTYAYDAAGRRTAVIDPLGGETRFEYDQGGNRTSETGPEGQTTRFEYDDENRLIRTTLATGESRTTEYDGAGRPVQETDEAGESTTFEYDAAGRLIAVTDALGQVSRYAYDRRGNRISQEDANGHVTTYSYDPLDRLVRRTLPDGSFETFEYDPAGRLVRRTTPDGHAEQLTYNAVNRLESESFPDGSTVLYSYTPTGQRAAVTDARGTTTYSYDSRDRLTRLTYPDGRAVTYEYDAAGNRVARTAVLASTTLTTRFEYDAANRLVGVTDPAGATYSYAYEPDGDPRSLVYPHGVTTTWTHDDADRLIALETHDAGGGVLQSFDYDLDARGHRMRVDEADGTSRTYELDALSRLVRATMTSPAGVGSVDTFAYDAVGNRVSRSYSSAADGTTSTAYTYDSRDRLLTAGATTYSWDDVGRLVSEADAGPTVYSWSFDDELLGATLPDGSAVAYEYDADGNRVSRTSSGPAGAAEEMELLVDPSGPWSEVLAETDETGALLAYYVRAGGDLLSVQRPGETRFAHHDGLGSVRTLTAPTGTVTDRYSYSAFGEPLTHQGSDPNPFTFTGAFRDDRTGLYDLRARWLDPRVGRFLTADPFMGRIEEPVTLHRYVYAGNDPVDRIDPSGLDFFEPGDPVFGTAVHTVISAEFGCWQGPFGRGLPRLCNREINTILRAAGQPGYPMRIRLKPDLVDVPLKDVFEIKPYLAAREGHLQLAEYLAVLNEPATGYGWDPGELTTFEPSPVIWVWNIAVEVSPPLGGVIVYSAPSRRYGPSLDPKAIRELAAIAATAAALRALAVEAQFGLRAGLAFGF